MSGEFEQNDILLFKFEKTTKGCRLKHFLHFLNSGGVRRPIRFAYIEAEGPLISNLSLRENIYLDSIPNSLSETKDFQMKSFLQRSSNHHLIDFYNRIPLLDELPGDVDAQTRKMAALFKGLLQSADYLFLESPERYLDDQALEVFTSALRFQTASRSQTVLLDSSNPKLWTPYASKVVLQSSGGNYDVEPILSGKVKRKFLELAHSEPIPEGNLRFLNLDNLLTAPTVKKKKAA
ncbi:MAG: hypothetical protein CME71_11260 [Halobacteriovorax sp.]|nr:hypothetical protein [Halobacteriovorax sp.]